MTLAWLLVFAFGVNIFFGYWRANVRTFSIAWFLAVHLSIPFIVGLRIWLMGLQWVTIPAFVAAFFLGQFSGSLIRKRLMRKADFQISSCLVMDLFRLARAGAAH